ncbi:non-ribosomal peptide synthetase [Streptomyces sp. NPDC059340]|uniref:non-ribosomal peptide synthetase n=1 Tax=Streptomyces sp. NPDC059340 TaxID=3346806 RepID=UPI00367B5767
MEATETAAERRLDLLLLRQWEREPDLQALIGGDSVVTAGELKSRVLALAAALRDQGVVDGDRVAVYQPRSIEFVVSLLAVVFAGAAHVAFDVGDPPERTRHEIEDCTARLVLTTREGAARLDPPAPVLLVDGHRQPAPDRLAPPRTTPDAPAVVLFTSGSTGRPKASVISHAAVASRMAAFQSGHPIGPGDRVLHHTTCTFDLHLAELYWPLLVGAAVVIAEPGRQRDAAHLARLIRSTHVTTFCCVPSLLELFLLGRDGAERYDGLKYVIAGGEALSPDLVRRFHARSTALLTNIYGPSECTVFATAWTCPRDPDPDLVLIGPPIPDTTVHLLDENRQPVPEGQPGEVYIGGVGVADGYLGRPELTADRFVTGVPGTEGRLYRTGDLARRDADGALEFLGRIDHQVKIRGVRVETGEIEATALRCPGVRQAAVVAAGDGSDKRLYAYVVPEPDADRAALPDEMRDRLGEWLPQAMLPSAIAVLDALPLTQNGKLDRRRLSERALAERPAPPTPLPAATDLSTHDRMEDLVSGIWRAVLGVPRLARDEDFFDIGGDSFRAVQVMGAVQDALGRKVPLDVLLRRPTVQLFSTELLALTRNEEPSH